MVPHVNNEDGQTNVLFTLLLFHDHIVFITHINVALTGITANSVLEKVKAMFTLQNCFSFVCMHFNYKSFIPFRVFIMKNICWVSILFFYYIREMLSRFVYTG